MREIKFRAWDLDNSYMFQVHTLSLPIKLMINTELMQYTGLLDKHGIEIYEGDIVVVNDDGFLVSDVFYFGCMFAYRDNVCEQPLGILCGNSKYSCEVIGNIYENHELLENK